jgi:hypothetical protein
MEEISGLVGTASTETIQGMLTSARPVAHGLLADCH